MRRWNHQGIVRQVQTGGPVRHNLVGEHQFLLVYCRLLYPNAEAEEVAAFIAQNSANPVLYSRQDISRREIELGLTRKKGSTTAFQALTPYNLERRRQFWNSPFPIGVRGVPRQDLFDIDEAGLWLEKKNRAYGKSIPGVRVRAPGVYGHGEKWTLILAINCAGHKYFFFDKVRT